MSENDRQIINAMQQYGGSFVKALAHAALLADEDNLRRIKEAWPEYWFRYSAIAKQMEARYEHGPK